MYVGRIRSAALIHRRERCEAQQASEIEPLDTGAADCESSNKFQHRVQDVLMTLQVGEFQIWICSTYTAAQCTSEQREYSLKDELSA